MHLPIYGRVRPVRSAHRAQPGGRGTRTGQIQRGKLVSVTDEAIEKIKTMIASGSLGLGDRLRKEDELASALGLSRNSLHEAVRALSIAASRAAPADEQAMASSPGALSARSPSRLSWSRCCVSTSRASAPARTGSCSGARLAIHPAVHLVASMAEGPYPGADSGPARHAADAPSLRLAAFRRNLAPELRRVLPLRSPRGPGTVSRC
jgi:hypothetical protein